ncbi:AraC family transcriptional regulator [Bradyrhizobium sp. AZCC 1678]|uniref:AraC family transcriptional regulator n=1 Tax=Bradyrhizobium sp. AZCC 1678 TaxID=3117030 RepID=UPI002FF06B12
MSCKPVERRLSQETQPGTAEAHQSDLQNGERPHADAEMTRVLKMAPVRIASDPSSGVIAYWKHDALHDVVAPMADHVLMTFPSGSLRFERRTGKSVVFGTARPGTVTVIPAGSTSRWDIPESLNVIHLYLPQTTLERVALEAGTASPGDLIDRSAHPDPITSRLLLSAADVLGKAGIRSVAHGLFEPFREKGIHVATMTVFAFVSPGSREASSVAEHFWHLYSQPKDSWTAETNYAPPAHDTREAMNMLRDTDESIVSIATALGYSSQTAFAAAF